MYNACMRIAIIGGGASGMAAALQAAWRGASVTLFERNAVVGRKLLVTGSGRCNITNDGASAEKYTCADPEWMAALLGCFGVQALRGMLEKIGILIYRTSDGWYYPLSNSAQTVVDAFAAALSLADVSLRLSSRVLSLSVGNQAFVLQWSCEAGKKEEAFDKVIVAAGGKAYPTLGSRGELFPILERLGLAVLPKRPALAPVRADVKKLKALQGVRLDAGVELWDGKDRLASAAGNLIFTEWGMNGPAVMDVSHHISARPGRPLILSLNFLRFFESEFRDLLQQKRQTRLPLRVFLGAFLPPKVASFFPELNHIPECTPLDRIEERVVEKLTDSLHDTRLPVKGVREFEYCQLSAGGVPVTGADPRTLESRLIKGLFLTGETLDVVGPCGGYNLQFAFGSGALAGMAAAGTPQK
jgi:predicted Rossmann fold flavoprotein